MANVRRIVTGHDGNGRSVFLEDGPSPQFNEASNSRVDYHELWNTAGTPAIIHAVEPAEPNDRALTLPPPPGGSIIRIIDVHPGNFRGMPPRADGRPSGMHRTRTIDYAVVLDGEIVALLEDSETLMKTGDVLIQRGTDHAWQNRSDRDCRLLFVLIDAVFSAELEALLPGMHLTVDAPSLKPSILERGDEGA